MARIYLFKEKLALNEMMRLSSNPASSADNSAFREIRKRFFCFWRQGSTKNSTLFKIQQKAVHENKTVQEHQG
ncbi:hypothetical protein [Sphingobacterium multivorum]|uniref:hypothetical protein n=1 Tax=Sphingobacterium multivorum TaxID=28454 RepID=UPI0028AD6FEB|nr:hypothetical protein [Sphingobacterium multivorum]